MTDTPLRDDKDTIDEQILVIQELIYEIKKIDPTFSFPLVGPFTTSKLGFIKVELLERLDIEQRKDSNKSELGKLPVGDPLGDGSTKKDTVDFSDAELEAKPEVSPELNSKLAAQEKLLATVGDQKISSGQQYFSLSVWGLMQKMAETFIRSKAIPKGMENKEQVLMVLQAGYEKGMKPIESLQSFAIINGRISMWGPAVLNRLRKYGWQISWPTSTEKECTMTITRGEEKYTESYSLAEAQDAGITTSRKDGKDYAKATWKSYPKLMLRYKCAQLHTKFNVPEVMENMYMAEESMELPADAVEEKREKVRALKANKQQEIVLP